MKLLTCCSFKGGAGKTTALMGLCSAFASTGKTVALFEADENRPLSRWMENAIESGTWDSQCKVFVADELSLLEEAYEEAEQDGFDYALADTHGGSSELNNTIIASSDFLLVPTMLTPLDIDEALSTYRYIIELLVAEKLDVQTAILQQRVPVGRATTSHKAACELLSILPQFGAPMYERDAFASMKKRGMLHLTLAAMSANPSMRLMARNYETAMDEVRALGNFVTHALED
ncbi:conjugal transfer ATPase VirC1 [Agrobacterium vitis]|uniref:conjugal transfer ATPase VirC1 n=1 Tax=Agrobacterium vitis TaxID=373 RepID=UPI00157328AF|nr:conjugal transfer ATPase VirC1 [Agrobacterium vitis]NSZ19489.1 conjugal transfer ATPase VirC1 [Agrobacterium vitis]QZO06803.1 conjugal transfer ATPase VirC1 [Agrobacterium vitis]UJL91535.1 conjugal transfer ATPase VirC1 [Agrobacterium vitis]BCH62602.1 protein virC1 [Agrobacterium vitis]